MTFMHKGVASDGAAPLFMHDPPTPSENRVSFPLPRAPLSPAFRYEIGGRGGVQCNAKAR